MLDMSLCGCVIGEYEHNLRRAVSGECGYSAENQEWCLDDEGVPTAYILDVWDLLSLIRGEVARIVREAIGLAKKSTHKYFVVGGAPCPDLSISGKFRGFLGFTGPVSVNYRVFPILLHTIRVLDPEAEIFVAVENGGSMQSTMREYMRGY